MPVLEKGGDKSLTKRPSNQFDSPNERGAITMMIATIGQWPRIDYKDPEQVAERFNLLFQHAAEHDIVVLPSTMALALGVSVRQLERWRSGEARQNPEVLRLIQSAYDMSMGALQMASLTGKVQPLQALAIQHSMGMQDNPDKVKEAATEDDRSATAQEIAMKYADMPDE